ncbi:tetratricopeptide repeat protein [Defluviitalea phaphyphila]|uniref:tetratricopeptide repeat protein n=1 Tax=Defluviitalea phaphyphila TaxID=1473580 RepID=UPI000730EFFF|nr:tetratricopeptide repeat protein [Defluviitalea phaphyphila]
MICPGCNNEVDNVKKCPICKFDILLYNKIKEISLKLYNKGLEQAKQRDLSGAVISLSKAILFDKNNIDARNLLGLVYFEMGEIGEALTQWVISSNLKREDNVSIDYINRIQNNKRKLEQYNDSIRMYNQSLEYIKQRSKDLAIIQLKKAISLNPNFVKAYCLLVLCLISENEKTKAISYIEKALKIDINNPEAIRYYRELNFKVLTSSRSNERVRNMPKHQKMKEPISSVGHIVGFITGVICTLALMFSLVIPDKTDALNNQIDQLTAKNQELEQKITQITSETEKSINELEEKNKEMEEENRELNEKLKILEEAKKVNQVDTLYKNGEIEEAATLLYSIDSDSISEENIELYNTLIDKVFKEAGILYYNKGVREYSSGSYDEAILSFEKSIMYVQGEYYSDNVLYYLGRIYEIKGDINKAEEFYNKAINEYAGSDGANNSKWRLERLK